VLSAGLSVAECASMAHCVTQEAGGCHERRSLDHLSPAGDPYNDFLSEGGKLWPRAKEAGAPNLIRGSSR
jgi:hypothetical protein